jgi:hypothetical protein
MRGTRFDGEIYDFVALDRSPCTLEGSEPLRGMDPRFDGALVLLHQVVQVGGRFGIDSADRASAPVSAPSLGIGRIAVLDDSEGLRMTAGERFSAAC